LIINFGGDDLLAWWIGDLISCLAVYLVVLVLASLTKAIIPFGKMKSKSYFGYIWSISRIVVIPICVVGVLIIIQHLFEYSHI